MNSGLSLQTFILWCKLYLTVLLDYQVCCHFYTIPFAKFFIIVLSAILLVFKSLFIKSNKLLLLKLFDLFQVNPSLTTSDSLQLYFLSKWISYGNLFSKHSTALRISWLKRLILFLVSYSYSYYSSYQDSLIYSRL